MPHPRGYGNNRVLGEYVRKRHVISLEEAVRKMTSLPAGHFRLTNRGLLKEGYAADVVVFNPLTVADAATSSSRTLTRSVFPMCSNGVVVVKNGETHGRGLGSRS